MLSDADLENLARDLGSVDGVVAVSLGGSRARGTHAPDSDVDLGVYAGAGLDRAALSRVASHWADAPVAVGPPGSWGPWVDSGAWLRVRGLAVDVIVRDVGRVGEQCRRAARGEFAFRPQPGHPFGFLDVAYAGEVALARPLVDGRGFLRRAAASVDPYPDALRRAIVADGWQIDFVLDSAAKAAGRRDAAYVSLCLADAVLRLSHVWHAHARRWAVNEKGLVAAVELLPGAPRGFSRDVAEVTATAGSTPESLHAAIDLARALLRPVRDD